MFYERKSREGSEITRLNLKRLRKRRALRLPLGQELSHAVAKVVRSVVGEIATDDDAAQCLVHTGLTDDAQLHFPGMLEIDENLRQEEPVIRRDFRGAVAEEDLLKVVAGENN